MNEFGTFWFFSRDKKANQRALSRQTGPLVLVHQTGAFIHHSFIHQYSVRQIGSFSEPNVASGQPVDNHQARRSSHGYVCVHVYRYVCVYSKVRSALNTICIIKLQACIPRQPNFIGLIHTRLQMFY